MPRFVMPVLVLCLMSISQVFGQNSSTAVCNFDSNSQLAVEYVPMAATSSRPLFGHEIPYNKVWAPGGKPMTMFVNHPVNVGGRELPIGAYTMFVIPAENKWTLIISRATDMSGKYDQQRDFVRVPMDTGELPSAESTFSVYFAHSGPNQCTMRLDLDRTRAWVDFEK